MFVLLMISVAIIIGISGCTQTELFSEPISSDDLEIQDFEWSDSYEKGHSAIHISSSLDIAGRGELTFFLRKADIYTYILINGNDVMAADYNYGRQGVHNVECGMSDVKLNSLEGYIDVKICFSKDIDELKRDLSSDKVICKEKTFGIPKFSLKVEPTEITLNYKKGEDFPKANIIITNDGEVPIEPNLNLVTGSNDFSLYESYYESYVLLPGQSTTREFVFNGRPPVGTHNTKGFVSTFFDNEGKIYKKEFDVKIVVTE